MGNWKRVMSCAVIALAFVATAMAQPAGPGGMSPEERAALARQTTPLAAKAIAQYVGVTGDAEAKFTAAYVAEAAAAQKRLADARQAGGAPGEGMMNVMRENSEKMQKVVEANLTAEQAKKAAALVGPFNALERSIQGLLRAKVETAKVEKALPVLVKYSVAQQEMTAKMREGGSREEIMAKVTELRANTAKELAPIVGEEAAAAWQKTSGMGRGMGGGRRGGGAGPQ